MVSGTSANSQLCFLLAAYLLLDLHNKTIQLLYYEMIIPWKADIRDVTK